MSKKYFAELLIVLVFLLSLNSVLAQDFQVWAEGPRLFTVGEPEQVQIYARKVGPGTDSYTISYSKIAQYQSSDVSHLVSVQIPSYRILSVQQGKVGNTIATVTMQTQVDSGSITFIATSDSTGLTDSDSIDIKSGTPISLPEFNIVGLIVIMGISTLFYLRFRNI